MARTQPHSLRLTCLFVALATAACLVHTVSGDFSARTSGQAPTKASAPGNNHKDKTIAQTVISYVAVGDSLAVGTGATAGNGYVPRYQQLLAADNNATVNLTNLAVSGSSSAALLNALQTDTTMRTALQGAQVISFNIGGIDLLIARNTYKQNQTSCGGGDNQNCLRTAVANFKTNWNSIIAEILSLRANTSVPVRTIDIYYPFVHSDMESDTFPNDGGLNDFQVFKLYLDEANNHIRATALSNGIGLGRVYRSFNGVDGGTDPGITYGLIAGDGFHPNNAGHAIIAERIRTGAPICLQPQTGLTAWYRAENNATDSTANSNNATLENGTAFVAGKVGQAFDLDGVDDSVSIPSINLGDSYTIEMWIKPAATQTDSFVHLASNDSETLGVFGAFGLFTDSSGNPASYSLKYKQGASERMETASVVLPNQWSHVAITHDVIDSKTRIYVNGALEATSSTAFAATYNNPLRLGHRFSGLFSFYKGQIDEASLYNRALSQSEIQFIVNADSEGKCLGTNLQISPTTATVLQFGTQQFVANGGIAPFTFSITVNHTSSSINPGTGLYSAANQIGTDTVRVTDAALFTSEATATVTATCGFSLSSSHKSFAGNGGTGSFGVTVASGCNWTAMSSDSWVTVTSGSGNGNGTVNYSVATNPGTSIRSATISISGLSFTVYQGIDFPDVPQNSVFYNEIGKLSARGITLGCTSDHTAYCPSDPVTREQMAAFILRAKGEFNPPAPPTQRFSDVPPQNVFYNFIDRLAELQITLGCTPDHLTYCPHDPVLRDQMSAYLLRGLGEFNPPTPQSQRFADVSPGNVFYNFIDRLAVLQITLGCVPDHTIYCPGAPVTREQMAAFLVRAFDL